MIHAGGAADENDTVGWARLDEPNPDLEGIKSTFIHFAERRLNGDLSVTTWLPRHPEAID